ncbi:hypothetical protein [Pseudothauera lacus]|uniref:Uncharacterized protein n=1 Tax=Pseudothauera lacus TaxID=2136175 RepID=A0A2T4II06_9RHOO|nr:hypothetical protein [Pseudothauera lacus]PTD97404.1 hypothetical protein C8261_05210 [Pseudothauera lacus]
MNLLASLTALLAPPPPPDARVAAGLARIGEILGAALSAERAFERRLGGPVGAALAHCDALVEALPPAIDLQRSAFASDPMIHALFATADDIELTLGYSAELREFLTTPEAWSDDYCHALMAARPQEKQVLGVARQGEVIATDVPRRLLYFSDHTVVLPAIDAAAARERLRAAAFDSLLRTFASHLEAAREAHQQLHIARELERARQYGAHASEPEWALRHGRRLAELDERLRASADGQLPGRLVDTLADFLANAGQALSLQAMDVRVDRDGAIVADGSASPADALSFMELCARDRRRHVVIPVRIACSEARQAVAHLREVRDRLLLI